MNVAIAMRPGPLPNVLRQIRNSEIPIRAYSVVHTGAKSQFGGAIFGLRRPLYHVGIEEIVKMEPITPAISQNATDRISLTVLSILCSMNHHPVVDLLRYPGIFLIKLSVF